MPPRTDHECVSKRLRRAISFSKALLNWASVLTAATTKMSSPNARAAALHIAYVGLMVRIFWID